MYIYFFVSFIFQYFFLYSGCRCAIILFDNLYCFMSVILFLFGRLMVLLMMVVFFMPFFLGWKLILHICDVLSSKNINHKQRYSWIIILNHFISNNSSVFLFPHFHRILITKDYTNTLFKQEKYTYSIKRILINVPDIFRSHFSKRFNRLNFLNFLTSSTLLYWTIFGKFNFSNYS